MPRSSLRSPTQPPIRAARFAPPSVVTPAPNSSDIYTAGSYGTGEAVTPAGEKPKSNTQLYVSTPSSGTGWEYAYTQLLGSNPSNGNQPYLFGSMSSGSNVGIWLINTSGSATTGATPWLVTGTSTDHSPYQFALFDNTTNPTTLNGYNVAYIADNSSASAEAAGTRESRNGFSTAATFGPSATRLPAAA